jgi:o-succinylbenzoate synthase
VNTLIDFDGAVVVAIPVAGGFGEAGDRECMLIEGPQGWGEFSPPRDADDARAARWLSSATEPGTVGWPDPARGRIPVAVGVPAVGPEVAHRLVRDSGCRTATVAVGGRAGSATEDGTRLEAVRDALGPDGRIRCAVEGRWDVETAVAAIPGLARAAGGLDYVEQPCGTIAELAAVRRRIDVPVAADASVIESRDAAVVADAADLVVLTCGALGGVRRSLRLAETFGLPCVVASGRETSVGLAAAVALAGVLPELPFASDVGRPPWVTGDVVVAGRSLLPVDGSLPVAPMPPAPDPELLARYAMTDTETLEWWRVRLRRARASGA